MRRKTTTDPDGAARELMRFGSVSMFDIQQFKKLLFAGCNLDMGPLNNRKGRKEKRRVS
jgi:hypothetical protein